jgi:hypothetical protein
MGKSPKDCALLGGNGNTLKIKTTARLNSTQFPFLKYQIFLSLKEKQNPIQ